MLLFEQLKDGPISPENLVVLLKDKLSRKTIYKGLANLTRIGYIVKYSVSSINSENQNEPRVMYDLRRPSGEVPSEIDFLNIVWKPLIHKTTRKEQRRQQKLLRIKKEWYIENIIKGEPLTDEKDLKAFEAIARWVYYNQEEDLNNKVGDLDRRYLEGDLCTECIAKGIPVVRIKNVCPECGLEGPPRL